MQTVMKPDTRLCSVLPYLKRGGRVVDVGTDHAYLPIYLVAEGISAQALACDINEGPIRSARANIAAAGLDDRIATLRTDGLCGVEQFHPDDVMIFGMGGELIARILADAPWVRSRDVGLILQPMTKASVLRAWLLGNGFAITGETITLEDKYYQTVAARYTGTVEHYTECELLIGRKNIEERPPHFEGLVRHEIHVLDAIIRGKSRSAHADTEKETRLKRALEELL